MSAMNKGIVAAQLQIVNSNIRSGKSAIPLQFENQRALAEKESTSKEQIDME